jgi:hypothetical protein
LERDKTYDVPKSMSGMGNLARDGDSAYEMDVKYREEGKGKDAEFHPGMNRGFTASSSRASSLWQKVCGTYVNVTQLKNGKGDTIVDKVQTPPLYRRPGVP